MRKRTCCNDNFFYFDGSLQLHFLRCTAFFIMLSEKPEYNSKIETMSALAPAVFLKHCKSRFIRLLKPFVSSLYVRFQLNLVSPFFKKKHYIFKYLQQAKHIVPIHHIYPALIQKKIFRNAKPTQNFCEKALDSLMGKSDQTIPVSLIQHYIC